MFCEARAKQKEEIEASFYKKPGKLMHNLEN